MEKMEFNDLIKTIEKEWYMPTIRFRIYKYCSLTLSQFKEIFEDKKIFWDWSGSLIYAEIDNYFFVVGEIFNEKSNENEE